MQRSTSPLAAVALLIALAPCVAAAQTADGLKCYKIKDPMRLKGVVDLDSAAFGLDAGCIIKKATAYCVPVTSSVVAATDGRGSLSLLNVGGPNPGDRICYRIKCPAAAPASQNVSDRFGNRTLSGLKATTLCVPAVKGTLSGSTSITGICADPMSQNHFVLDCDEASGYFAVGTTVPNAAEPELHIFTIYEAVNSGFGQEPPVGAASVHVARQARIVLALASYAPVDWTITAEPGTTLERVILSGYYEQTATVPAGVTVENRSPDTNGAFQNTGYVDWPEPAVLGLITEVEEAAGLCMKSVHGCYRGTQFVVPEP